MAPSRGRTRAKSSNSRNNAASTPKSATRPNRRAANAVPDVYQDLLAEVAVTNPEDEASDRPLKRRKVAASGGALRNRVTPEQHSADSATLSPTKQAASAKARGKRPFVDHALEANKRQTIEESSEDDDESDYSFQDVDLDQPTAPANHAPQDGIADLSISVGQSATAKRSVQRKRRPATSAEKARRLVIHKLHFLCLLAHGMYVNSWCIDTVTQKTLRPLLSAKTRASLSPSDNESQFQRNRTFLDGLNAAAATFKLHFSVTASGMRRARWLADGETAEDAMDDSMEMTSREDFRRAARDMEGSQDTGNQLFCAMLRAAGVNARLVCSIQALPFTSIGAALREPTPKKNIKRRVYAYPRNDELSIGRIGIEDSALETSSTLQHVPSARRRLNAPGFEIEQPTNAVATPPSQRKPPVRKLAYPTFWVEAFNEAHQNWIALDPIVTETVNKASKIEPPASYADNQLTYAIAFEDDGAARDVTIRYAKSYNAKTRRQRVESTLHGTEWLKRSMRLFPRPRSARRSRDAIEDAELNQKLAREGMPSNVQDFKDHPIYALERHLKRNEVIHPRRDCGKVNAGTAARPRMEAVFRRKDVLRCLSGDKWYRLGREVKLGEQPLKFVASRRIGARARSPTPVEIGEDRVGQSTAQTGLYSASQTTLYIPQPVVRGRVPRNAFGNLDVYVPSMVPAGGTHIRHPLARRAALLLRVDAVDAVTGFSFKGRQGTAVVEGVVVPKTFAEAVQGVIEGLELEAEEDESRARSLVALNMWKMFLTKLRIKERVSAYGSGNAEGDENAGKDSVVSDNETEPGPFSALLAGPLDNDKPFITAGRLSLLDADMPRSASKKKSRKVAHDESESEAEAALTPDEDGEEEYVPSGTRRRSGRRNKVLEDDNEEAEYIPNARQLSDGGEDEGGGLLVEEDNASDKNNGGFMPDADDFDGGGGFLVDDVDDTKINESDSLPMDNLSEGGFLLDDDDGGGFLPGTDAASSEAAVAVPLTSDSKRQIPEDGARENCATGGHCTTRQPSPGNVTLEPGSDTTKRTPSEAKRIQASEDRDDGHQRMIGRGPDRNTALVTDEDKAPSDNEPARPEPHSGTGDDGVVVKPAPPDPALRSESIDAGFSADLEGDGDQNNEDDLESDMLSQDPEDEDAEPDWLESD